MRVPHSGSPARLAVGRRRVTCVDVEDGGERVVHGRRGRLLPDITIDLHDESLATPVAAYWLVDNSGRCTDLAV